MNKWLHYTLITVIVAVSILNAKPGSRHRVRIRVKKSNHIKITSELKDSGTETISRMQWDTDTISKKVTITSIQSIDDIHVKSESQLLGVLDSRSGMKSIPIENASEEKAVKCLYTITDS